LLRSDRIDLIYLPRSNLHLDHKRIGIRNDKHDLLARRNYAADGMDRQLMDTTALGSSNVDPV
jgi:hypothetical protein